MDKAPIEDKQRRLTHQNQRTILSQSEHQIHVEDIERPSKPTVSSASLHHSSFIYNNQDSYFLSDHTYQ